MKNFTKHLFLSLGFLLLLIEYSIGFGQSQNYTTAGTYTFVVPCGVTAITVKAYGAGGGGGGANGTAGGAGGGGGGGAYAGGIVTVTPGQSISVVVGAIGAGGAAGVAGGTGGTSSFNATSIVAVGGAGGLGAAGNVSGAAGAGGTIAASTGTTKWAGGAGAAGVSGAASGAGGGGGASANPTANGTGATGSSGGAGVSPSGNGGSGVNNTAGGDGTVYGAGGAGGHKNGSNRKGGDGAAGAVLLSWTGSLAYCVPTFTNAVEPITNVTFAGINNTTTNTVGGNVIESFCISASVIQGSAYPISLKGNTNGSFTSYFRVYIDWNQNTSFADAGESFDIGTINGSTGIDAAVVTGSITVPAGATLGTTSMRVMKRYSSYSSSPCQTGTGYGQAEDYLVTVNPLPACSGTPVAGTASPATQNVASGNTAVISLSGTASVSGLTYQWQESTTSGGTFTNVTGGTGATTSSYTTVPLASSAVYYRCIVTCTGSGISSTSSVAEILRVYCTPTSASSSSYISNVVTTAAATNISNSTGAYSATGYGNFTAMSASQYQGSSFSYSITSTSGMGIGLWIDWNNDYDFVDAGENIGITTGFGTSLTGSYTVPSGQAAGNYRMRIVGDFNAIAPNPCSLAGTRGETEDYTFTVLGTAPCAGTPNAGTAAISAASGCGGLNFNLTTTSISGGSGITYQWQSSPAGAGTWSNISGATSSTLTTNTTTNTDYRLLTTCTNSSLSNNTNTVTYTANSGPSNNSCALATNLPCGTANLPASTVCTPNYAHGTAPGISNYGVWYKFTGTGASTTILTNANNFDHEMVIMSGSCGSYTLVADIDNSTAAASETYTFVATAGVTYFVYVAYYSATGTASNTGTFNISRSEGAPVPSAISGSTCANASGIFSVTNVPGTTYAWTLPTGWTGSSTSNSITATATATGGTISVTATNGCGTSAASSRVIAINPSPVASVSPSTGGVCPGGSIALTGSPVNEISTVLYSENFESYAVSDDVPSTWDYGYFGDDYLNFWVVGSLGANTGNRSLTIMDGWDAVYNSYRKTPAFGFNPSSDVVAYPLSAINAVGYSNLKLNFTWKCQGEAGKDYGRVMYSFDGMTWTAFPTQYSGTGTTVNTVTNMDLSVLNNTSFYIGFEWINDNAGGTNPPFTVDDISIKGDKIYSYAWDNGGTLTASNVYNPTASPATTTTYTMTVTNTSTGCSAQSSTTISINPIPAVTITSSSSSICHGNTFAVGGNVTAAGAWTVNLSNGQTATGTGNQAWNINVAPTATTTYTLSSITGTCGSLASLTGSTTLTLPTAGTDLATNNETATCNVSGNNWVHFYSSGGHLIASVNSNGNNLGSVTATSFVDGSAILTQSCGSGIDPAYTTAVLGRRWVITPTNNQAASIRFPFADGELTSLHTASVGTTSNPLDNVNSIGDLKMSHYSGSAQNGDWADNCAGGGSQLVPSQAGNGTTASGNGFVSTISGSSYVQFNTPGFSEFWLHNTNNISPLPVELLAFSANCGGQHEVSVNWSTATEMNSQKFIIEKSRDLAHWDYVSSAQAAGNSTHQINYTSVHADPLGGVSYYRLVQVDNDGSGKTYGPISVSCSDEDNSMTVFPNPTKGSFTVEITSSESLVNAEIQLTDLTGKIISSRRSDLVKGKNQVLFEESGLQIGTYLVSLASGSEFKPVKVVVN